MMEKGYAATPIASAHHLRATVKDESAVGQQEASYYLQQHHHLPPFLEPRAKGGAATAAAADDGLMGIPPSMLAGAFPSDFAFGVSTSCK